MDFCSSHNNNLLSSPFDHNKIQNVGKYNHHQIDQKLDIINRIVKEPSGWENQDGNILSFNNTTRTLTISPTSGLSFNFYVNGKEFWKQETTIIITNDNGHHYIYFDTEGIIQELLVFDTVLLQTAYVCAIYWNTTAQECIYIGDERHSWMGAKTHEYLHLSFGAQYISGALPTDINLGNGQNLIDCQFGVYSGVMIDEDITHNLSAVPRSQDYYIYYKTGSVVWNRSVTKVPVMNCGTGLMCYNYLNGSNWELKECGNNNYCCQHLFMSNSAITDEEYIIIMGEAEYTNKPSAFAGVQSEMNDITTGGLFSEEWRPVASFLYQTNSLYLNGYFAKIVKDDENNLFIDYRFSNIAGIGSSTCGIDLISWKQDYDNKINQSVLTTSDVVFNSLSLTDLYVDTNLIYTNSTNNYVGINTSTPEHSLQINGDLLIRGGDFNTSKLLIEAKGPGDGWFSQIQATDDYPGKELNRTIKINPDGGDVSIVDDTLYIDSVNDRVGINKIPATELDINGNCNISGNLIIDTDTLYIDSVNDRVGINKIPLVDLDILGNVDITGNLEISGDLKCDDIVLGDIKCDDLFVDTNLIYTNSTNNYVGINNSSPSCALDITGNLELSGTSTFSDDLIVGTTKLFVDVSGSKVGINTNIPGYALQVDGSNMLIRGGDFNASMLLFEAVGGGGSWYSQIQAKDDYPGHTLARPLKINPVGGNILIGQADYGGHMPIAIDQDNNKIGIWNNSPAYPTDIRNLVYMRDKNNTINYGTAYTSADDCLLYLEQTATSTGVSCLRFKQACSTSYIMNFDVCADISPTVSSTPSGFIKVKAPDGSDAYMPMYPAV